MKKIISLLLALLLGLFCLAGCALFEEDVESAATTAGETTQATTKVVADIDWYTNDVSLIFPYYKNNTVFAKAKFKSLVDIRETDRSAAWYVDLKLEVIEDYYQTVSAGELIYVTLCVVRDGSGDYSLKQEYQDAVVAKLEAEIPVDSEAFLEDNPFGTVLKKDEEYIFYGVLGNTGAPFAPGGETWFVESEVLFPVQAERVNTRVWNGLFSPEHTSFSDTIRYQYYVKDTYPPQYEDPILTQDMPVAEAEENLRELYQRWQNGTVYEFVPSDYIITK